MSRKVLVNILINLQRIVIHCIKRVTRYYYSNIVPKDFLFVLQSRGKLYYKVNVVPNDVNLI